jgi:hypothetical protein
MGKYSFAWVTGALFLFSLVGHWLFGWFAYVDEQQALAQPIEAGGYVVEMMRDTLENWQSEFLQLVWQVVGLTILYYAGSPQSRGDDERIEEKLDSILRKVDPETAERLIQDLEVRYPKK